MPETLEEGLDRSANKRGLIGKERHRYIGGALRNMAKRGAITLRKRSGKKLPKSDTTPHKPTFSGQLHRFGVDKRGKAQREYYDVINGKQSLLLEAKKNVSASKTKGYTVYSVYNKRTGAQYGSYASKSLAGAKQEAIDEMDAHNHPRGEHVRSGLF